MGWWHRRISSALFLLTATALPAQSILGTWQGKLPVAENSRVVLLLEDAGNGSLHGVFYQVEKSAEGIPLTEVTFANRELKLTQLAVNMAYEGRLSADGKSVEGIWTQLKETYPLTLTLATPQTVWKHEGSPTLTPMAATADPSFEVATIKPSSPDANKWSIRTRTRRFSAEGVTAEDLIKYAWNIRGRQIEGEPSWVAGAKYDLAGEPDVEGQPSEDQCRIMVQKLLAVRFGLKIHIIQKEFPVYALTVDRSRARLAPSDPEFWRGSIYVKAMPEGDTLAQFSGHSMPMFAEILMNFIPDRQIVDETGLQGHFEFTLHIDTADLQSSSPDTRRDAMLRAVPAAGFKLTPKREPLNVVVIDHIEKPSEN